MAQRAGEPLFGHPVRDVKRPHGPENARRVRVRGRDRLELLVDFRPRLRQGFGGQAPQPLREHLPRVADIPVVLLEGESDEFVVG